MLTLLGMPSTARNWSRIIAKYVEKKHTIRGRMLILICTFLLAPLGMPNTPRNWARIVAKCVRTNIIKGQMLMLIFAFLLAPPGMANTI